MELTREMFEAWVNHPVTQAVAAELRRRRGVVLETMALGRTLRATDSNYTLAHTASFVAQAQLLAEISALSYDDLFTSTEEPHAENI